MARDTLPVQVVTWVLVLLATVACELAALPETRLRAASVIELSVVVVLAVVLNRLVKRANTSKPAPPKLWLLLVGSAMFWPIAFEPVFRSTLGEGNPLEMQMIHGLRCVGLLSAGLAAWPLCRRLAAVISLFLALFASAMGDQAILPYLVVAYALLGGVWLVLENLNRSSATKAMRADTVEEGVAIRWPVWELVLFGLLAIATASVAVVGPKRVMLVLGEWMPTSGGTGDTDPFARYGIGDGPEEVAGDNAKAAGMVETDKMIEDNRNALIDAVNDMYGPPHKPRKDQDKMIAAGVAQIIENHGKLPDNRRPSREFDTSRAGRKSDKTPESQAARGVLEVEGRTPLHIRLVAYETYDFTTRTWLEGRKPGNRLFESVGDCWFNIGHFRDADWYAQPDTHRLKVANLKDNLVPTPGHVTRFRINKVDQSEHYDWQYEGVLVLKDRKATPPGVVVTTDCRTLNPALVPENSFSSLHAVSATSPIFGEVPAELKVELTRKATEWAGAEARGWPQIQALLTKLRSEYILDSTAKPPADHPAPVLWFLNESRRGPDYLFATSAALMLRTLGYPARVSLGYYASPEAFDSATGHTPVKASDLHLWPEVSLRDGQWLVIEPTPGYGVLPPLQTWGEWATEKWNALVAWTLRNVVAFVLAGLLLALLIWKRKLVLDALFTLAWRLRPGASWEQQVLRTARLLERRAGLAGVGRTQAQTVQQWSTQLPADIALSQFVQLVEQAAYAPGLPVEVEVEVRPLCKTVLRVCSYRRLCQPGVRE
jgi:protein-glutamine gamma-glutamyltransferase